MRTTNKQKITSGNYQLFQTYLKPTSFSQPILCWLCSTGMSASIGFFEPFFGPVFFHKKMLNGQNNLDDCISTVFFRFLAVVPCSPVLAERLLFKKSNVTNLFKSLNQPIISITYYFVYYKRYHIVPLYFSAFLFLNHQYLVCQLAFEMQPPPTR